MSKYSHAFARLKEEYKKAAATKKSINEYSPIKEVEVLHCEDGVPDETLTHMHGKALDGATIDKTIYVNDEKNETDDDVILFDNHHVEEERFHNVGLTRLRCGLMTCVALDEAMRLLGIGKVNRVGFIGNGKTNIQNAECIADLFGSPELVIRGSARDRGKNREAFEQFGRVTVDDTADYSVINTCDAVISCTSTCDPADQVSASVLNHPRIFIALDTGYLLDESFRRECEAFADDVPQLEAYYREEFIFDRHKTHLKQLTRDTHITKDRIAVYMFGISFADAEVAEMVYTHDLDGVQGEIEKPLNP